MIRVLDLHGEIGIERRALLDREFDRIKAFGSNSVTILDLTDVSYADSTLINALNEVHENVGGLPGSQVCVVASKPILRLFWITGLDWKFPVFEDLSSAIEYAALSWSRLAESPQSKAIVQQVGLANLTV